MTHKSVKKSVKIGAILCAFLASGCSISQETRNNTALVQECYSMRGEAFTDTVKKTVRCYRATMFMREPKLLFEKSYLVKDNQEH